VVVRPPTRAVTRPSTREIVTRNSGAKSPVSVSKTAYPLISKDKRMGDRKMGGLSLPDVVRELLKEKNILRWDSNEGVYEVVHGEHFEIRFNELRKVRNKTKPSGVERPFSRMYNFFILESGEKWAKTGTRFRPRNSKGMPNIEPAQKPAKEVRRVHPTPDPAQTSSRNEVEAEPPSIVDAKVTISEADAPAVLETEEQVHGETIGGGEEQEEADESEPCSSETEDTEETEEFFTADPVSECNHFHDYAHDAASDKTGANPADGEDAHFFTVEDAASVLSPPAAALSFGFPNPQDMDVDSLLRPEDHADLDARQALPAGIRAVSVYRPGAAAKGDGPGVEHTVYEVSSPEASCRSSPEGVLSLCGEFGGSPLDIGAPAVAALMLGEACDAVLVDAPADW